MIEAKTRHSIGPDVNERVRTIAEYLFVRRYNRNQSALAKEIDVGQSNIRRYVVLKLGSISNVNANKLCKLAGVKFPPSEEDVKHFKAELDQSTTTPSIPPPPPRRKSTTLEQILTLLGDDFTEPAKMFARGMVAHGVRDIPPKEWIHDILPKLDEIALEYLDKYKNPQDD